MICCASESVSQVWTCCNREWLRLYLSTGIICPSFWYESMMLHVYTVLFPAFLRSQHCQHLSSGIHETTSPQNWKLKLVMFQIQRLLHDRCWMITTIFWQQTVPSVQQIEPCFAGGMVSPSLDPSPASRCPFSSFCWCPKFFWAKGGQRGRCRSLGFM